MNPRLFCRERAFHRTLLLTYSFDPIFFEQMVLPDLWAGRSGDILAIGDRAQVMEATAARAGQLWHLGKHYLLAAARHEGAFHPKVILRLGAKDGAVTIGSGNLTSSGWGGNQELGTSWRIGPDHPDQGAWLHRFLTEVMGWCSSDLERDAVARMRDTPWLSLTPEYDASSDLLFSHGDITLAALLAARWTGRRFDEVKILTGSTDETGAFLRWAHATFGIRRAVVALTPAMASFDPGRLGDLPLDLSLIEAPSDRPMHAKCYWFEGPNGVAAVMGSANCSAAAWLVPPNRAGNIETVVVYDHADQGDYEDVLRIFERTAHTAEALLGDRPVVKDNEPIANERPFRLQGLRWDREINQVLAVLEPSPPAGSVVELLLQAQAVVMEKVEQAAVLWTCSTPDTWGEATSFATIRIFHDGTISTTEPRWIDDIAALRSASQSARLLEPFKGLERAVTSSEQRQMLEDLQEVAHALFNDPAAFRDPGRQVDSDKGAEQQPVAAPVNPQDLICHLEDGFELKAGMTDPRSTTLSISGILRMLFDVEGDGADIPVAMDGKDEMSDMSDSLHVTGGRKTDVPEGSFAPLVVEAKFRERLASQISIFLVNLRSSEFANSCSATQMVQAVAFPLAVAIRGKKHGWVSQELAERWAIEVIALLFRGAGLHDAPLLRGVQSRYAKNGQADVFADIVGDGTLWIALVSLLGGSQWGGPGAYMEKAIALREVFESPVLIGSARPDRIKSLIGRIRVEDAHRYLAEVAPQATSLLAELEDELKPLWASESKSQDERKITHKTGDVLWRERVGWAVCLEDNALMNKAATKVRLHGQEKSVAAGFYVNVSEVALRVSSLGQKLDAVRSLVDVRA